MAGGKATLLHHIFQKTGMTPDEFLAKPLGVQAFCLASMQIAIESMQKGGETDGGDDTN